MTSADAILADEVGFDAIEQALKATGWQRVEVAGLRGPLLAGEPELARFENGDASLTYTFNPAIRLRLLTGPVPAGLAHLDQQEVRAALAEAHDDDARLRAILGCVAMGWALLGDHWLGHGGRRPVEVPWLSRVSPTAPVCPPTSKGVLTARPSCSMRAHGIR